MTDYFDNPPAGWLEETIDDIDRRLSEVEFVLEEIKEELKKNG